MSCDINIGLSKEEPNLNTENSYIVLENILYCSSPKRGIKSKSSTKNKNFTPFTATTDMHTSYFTFNIREASTDIGSKEEIVPSIKSSNIITEFSLSNLKNSKLNNTSTSKAFLYEKEEKENMKIFDENLEKEFKEEEFEDNNENVKLKNEPKDNKNDNFMHKISSFNIEDNKPRSHRNSLLNIEESIINNENNCEKKLKKRHCRHSSIHTAKKPSENQNEIKIGTKKVKRYCSVNYPRNKKKKKTIKSHFCKDNMTKEKEVLKDIKDKLKNKDDINVKKNNNHKEKEKDQDRQTGKKIKKIKFSKSFRHLPVIVEQNLNLLENTGNNVKIETKTEKKNTKNKKSIDNKINSNNNFEDQNLISHPIEINNDMEEFKNENNLILVKSSKYISQREYSLLKEIDRDKKKHTTDINNNKRSFKSSRKKSKLSKNHYTKRFYNPHEFTEKKYSKEISYFNPLNEESNKKKAKGSNKYLSINIFRKSHNKINEHKNDEYPIYKAKNSAKHNIYFVQNKDKEKEKYKKLQSSVTLHDNYENKKHIENIKEIHYQKNLKRRYTTFATKGKNKLFMKNSNNKNINDESDSLYSNKDENNDKNEKNESISKNESLEEKQAKMKIRKITEDKLILKYKNKNEIIEVLSDKENINNYYEYLKFCLDTLQEINLPEVPKSKAKIDFKFPNERKNKKIALFDLDETLVHCIGEIKKENYDSPEFKDIHKINVVLPSKKEVIIGINIRPHLKELLDIIKDLYNIVIFTASHQSYSDAVLNYLDPEDKYFHYRLYRDSCVQYRKNDINFYVKDLDIFKDNYDLKDIIIIDNSILSFAYHLNNGIPVVPFYDSKQDSELPLLSFYLISIANNNDLRDANKEHIKLEYFLAQAKNEISLNEETMLESIDKISMNGNPKENSIMNNIKININENSPRRVLLRSDIIYKNKDSEVNNNIEESKFNPNDDKINDMSNFNKSEKKLLYLLNDQRNFEKRKKFNTVKLQSFKIVDFFDKWKNAYLQLALKK